MKKVGFLLLCGGHSNRMGQPKALLPIEGIPLVEHVARAGVDFDERIFSVNGDIPVPEGFRAVADEYEDCGPLGGIHAALSVCKSDALVCAPCDTPRYTRELAAFLAAQMERNLDALILQDDMGRIHPLMGVYARRCLPVLTEHVQKKKLKIMRMLDMLETKVVTLPPEISQEVFINLNTPDAYERYLAAQKR